MIAGVTPEAARGRALEIVKSLANLLEGGSLRDPLVHRTARRLLAAVTRTIAQPMSRFDLLLEAQERIGELLRAANEVEAEGRDAWVRLEAHAREVADIAEAAQATFTREGT